MWNYKGSGNLEEITRGDHEAMSPLDIWTGKSSEVVSPLQLKALVYMPDAGGTDAPSRPFPLGDFVQSSMTTFTFASTSYSIYASPVHGEFGLCSLNPPLDYTECTVIMQWRFAPTQACSCILSPCHSWLHPPCSQEQGAFILYMEWFRSWQFFVYIYLVIYISAAAASGFARSSQQSSP
jgi:hypothetical protein